MIDLISLEDGLGFSQQEIFELNKTYLNPGLTELMALLELNIKFVRSDGTVIWDEDGNEYLDFVSGYGTLNLGHNPRVVLDAIERVKGCLLYTSIMSTGPSRREPLKPANIAVIP